MYIRGSLFFLIFVAKLMEHGAKKQCEWVDDHDYEMVECLGVVFQCRQCGARDIVSGFIGCPYFIPGKLPQNVNVGTK